MKKLSLKVTTACIVLAFAIMTVIQLNNISRNLSRIDSAMYSLEGVIKDSSDSGLREKIEACKAKAYQHQQDQCLRDL
ncbi:hypothetical protein QTO01_18180 [Vibrio mytili]|uniref:hypothetical protein n=1 Tax=Vibrio harveyi group TaxID=717610 RepID=UPI002F406D01